MTSPDVALLVPVRLRSAVRAEGLGLLLLYLGLLDLAEWSLTVSVPLAATCFGLLALAVCAVRPGALEEQTGALLPPLVALPVVRLVTVGSLPALPFGVGGLARLATVSVLALLTVALTARDRPPSYRLFRPGSTGWRVQAGVAALGLPLALVAYVLAPGATVAPVDGPPVAVAPVLVLAALAEEVLFRGLLLPAAVGVAGRAGVVLAAVTYAVTYVGYASVGTLVAALVVGFVLGACRYRTGSAVGPIGARAVMVVVAMLLPAIAG